MCVHACVCQGVDGVGGWCSKSENSCTHGFALYIRCMNVNYLYISSSHCLILAVSCHCEAHGAHLKMRPWQIIVIICLTSSCIFTSLNISTIQQEVTYRLFSFVGRKFVSKPVSVWLCFQKTTKKYSYPCSTSTTLRNERQVSQRRMSECGSFTSISIQSSSFFKQKFDLQ